MQTTPTSITAKPLGQCPAHAARLVALAMLLLVVLGCRSNTNTHTLGPDPTQAAQLPAIPREFRGVWVASVANIDWPSAPGLTADQQRAELVFLLDTCVELNLNAVILQVRPACDALYPSPIEPWSVYLTGAEGQAPAPEYDPLHFAVTQAHARGLELHAWFNPFRAGHATFRGEHAANHISNTHPHLVRSYGRQLWLDPGDADARAHSLKVIRDVVERYDIDGVHLDDYFYPYPVNGDDGTTLDFPDELTYKRYQEAGGQLPRNDWRRDNVNTFVRDLYTSVKELKPHVQVGISPFGIYRPGHPAYVKGFDQYERIYADAKRWLDAGWCDYFVPQLYWAIDNPDHSFTGLLRWWHANNNAGRHLYPGLYTSRTEDGSARGFRATEVPYQVRWSRILAQEAGVAQGHVHFSMRALLQNRAGLADTLGESHYAHPALTPASPWLTDQRPSPPQPDAGYTLEAGLLGITVTPDSLTGARLWVVQVQRGGAWQYDLFPASESRIALPLRGRGTIDRVAIWTVDRAGVGSAVVEVQAAE
ncbi:MAG: glycoside hydrolase family 10 protein [Phycisphaerales bacterium JB063]